MDKIVFISPERLKTYEKHTDKQAKAIALHNQTLQLGSSLMSMIALMELALRNSTNQQLVDDFEDVDWLLPNHSTVPLKKRERNAAKSARALAQKAAYSKLSYREKSHLDAFAFPGGVPPEASHKMVAKKRQELFVVSHGQVIAQTTIAFWKRLYSSDYDSILWRPSLKRVFPNKKLKRSDISQALETIYAMRNRVAHHEPMYGQRLAEAISALEFIRDNLGAKQSGDNSNFKQFSRLQYLRLRMDYETFEEAWSTLCI